MFFSTCFPLEGNFDIDAGDGEGEGGSPKSPKYPQKTKNQVSKYRLFKDYICIFCISIY